MIKINQIAKDVRVVLNSNFRIKSLSDEYLACEPILFISEGHVYEDTDGKYIFIKGGSLINSGRVYLNEIDLEFPISEKPMYCHKTINYNRDLSMFKGVDNTIKYGDFVRMNDRWTPKKITEEEYYDEIGRG